MRNYSKIVLPGWLMLLGGIMILNPVFANGCYIPEKVYRKLPDIPAQRALVRYENGAETLIIESTLDGEGQKFGWIIPVPAKPTRLEKSTPGLLKTLSMTTQPEITHDTKGPKGSDISFLWLMALAFLISLIIVAPGQSRRTRLYQCCVVVLGMAIIGSIAIPNLLESSLGKHQIARPTSSVKIHRHQVVGSYEVFVLTAEKSTDLNTWLKENGFAEFPLKARPILDDYIAEKWHFVAAKLVRESGKVATPHPILIEFRTDKPVYPMRLTALPGSKLYLELFIVAAQEGVPAGYNMEKEYCEHFTRVKHSDGIPDFTGKQFEAILGHPALCKLVRGDFVLTKLAGSIASDAMREDMFLSFKEPAYFKAHFYSKQGARKEGLDLAVQIWIIVLLVGSIAARKKFRESPRLFWRALLDLSLICALVWGGFYLCVKKVDIVRSGRDYFSSPHAEGRLIRNAFQVYKTICMLPNEEINTAAKAFISTEQFANPYTGSLMIVEDSPGNITWQRKGGKVVVTGYGEGGRAVVIDEKMAKEFGYYPE